MNVDRPIIIIGAGRSGSTVFHELFARHSRVAFLSRLCHFSKDTPSVNRLYLRLIDLPMLGHAMMRLVPPDENYRFWEHHCPGFRHPFRDLGRDDLTQRSRQRVHRVFGAMLTRRRNRMLIKVTGWPRIPFLHELFPDAKFVHVVRDGRAVINSMMEIPFWRGWEGPGNWRFGPLPTEYDRLWESHHRSFVALAGIQWRMILDAIRKGEKQVPARQFLELKYEDLCRDPVDVLRRIVDFCEMEWDNRLHRSIAGFALQDNNYKWRSDLTAEQQEIIQDVLHEPLSSLGYS